MPPYIIKYFLLYLMPVALSKFDSIIQLAWSYLADGVSVIPDNGSAPGINYDINYSFGYINIKSS